MVFPTYTHAHAQVFPEDEDDFTCTEEFGEVAVSQGWPDPAFVDFRLELDESELIQYPNAPEDEVEQALLDHDIRNSNITILRFMQGGCQPTTTTAAPKRKQMTIDDFHIQVKKNRFEVPLWARSKPKVY